MKVIRVTWWRVTGSRDMHDKQKKSTSCITSLMKLHKVLQFIEKLDKNSKVHLKMICWRLWAKNCFFFSFHRRARPLPTTLERKHCLEDTSTTIDPRIQWVGYRNFYYYWEKCSTDFSMWFQQFFELLNLWNANFESVKYEISAVSPESQNLTAKIEYCWSQDAKFPSWMRNFKL